jgi:hypothetical protein
MNQLDTNMMMRFLERNYPVSRVKDNMRFKRAIILDNGTSYFLSDEHSHIQLRLQLNQILKTVFYCDENTSRTVLKEFLNL